MRGNLIINSIRKSKNPFRLTAISKDTNIPVSSIKDFCDNKSNLFHTALLDFENHEKSRYFITLQITPYSLSIFKENIATIKELNNLYQLSQENTFLLDLILDSNKDVNELIKRINISCDIIKWNKQKVEKHKIKENYLFK